jgi:hypothetical protein
MSDVPTTTSTVSRTELMRRAIPGVENLEAVMYLLSLPPEQPRPHIGIRASVLVTFWRVFTNLSTSARS